MKVILSRKGADGGNWKFPSPILPDGRMLSFPIYSEKDSVCPNDLYLDGVDIKKLILDLHPNLSNDARIRHLHLDPDLNRNPNNRPKDWRPSLGQVNAAQGILSNHKVNTNDVFLFFGWFKHVEEVKGKWKYCGKDIHSLFGWLEIENVLNFTDKNKENLIQQYHFLKQHPHYNSTNLSTNTVYISKDKSNYSKSSEFGAGVFRFSEKLQLTAEGRSKSQWLLPRWFKPDNLDYALSSHHNSKRWIEYTASNDKVILQSVYRGQEFVMDSQYFPELEDWITEIIQEGTMENLCM
ncbi:hypothetical protein [Lonepinella sp. MS14437]|uniref:Nmad3 family putative nucleotide modification protein n=1 Tax=unclassified Lonepinella TaxID=2642006 RepID=UPI0036DAAC53